MLKIVEKEGDYTNVVSGKNIKDGPMDEYFMIFLSGEIKNSAMSADSVVPCLSAPTRMELISGIHQTNLSMDQKTRLTSFICVGLFQTFSMRLWMLPQDTW